MVLLLIKFLCCYNNELTYLPVLPNNLFSLNCHKNQIICLPDMPENLNVLYFVHNPIYNLIYEKINSNNLFALKQKIRILTLLKGSKFVQNLKLKLLF